MTTRDLYEEHNIFCLFYSHPTNCQLASSSPYISIYTNRYGIFLWYLFDDVNAETNQNKFLFFFLQKTFSLSLSVLTCKESNIFSITYLLVTKTTIFHCRDSEKIHFLCIFTCLNFKQHNHFHSFIHESHIYNLANIHIDIWAAKYDRMQNRNTRTTIQYQKMTQFKLDDYYYLLYFLQFYSVSAFLSI